jgi:hypothetical protein
VAVPAVASASRAAARIEVMILDMVYCLPLKSLGTKASEPRGRRI